jgi:hypothetical protein
MHYIDEIGEDYVVVNWGLAEWQKQDAAGEKPSAYALKKQFSPMCGVIKSDLTLSV